MRALEREREELALRVELAELRRRVEVTNENPGFGATATYPLSDPNAWAQLFGGLPEQMSAQKALTHGAVYRCVFLIAGAITMLDLKSYRNAGAPEEEAETDSPQARLIAERPNPRYSSVAFWRSIIADMLLNGNGIAWIERNGAGAPVNLWWIPWNRCGVHFARMPDETVALVYALTQDDGTIVVAHQDDVLHFGGSPIWNLFYYSSPIGAYAASVGIGISADKYAKAYFDNGFSSDSVISYQTNKTTEQSKEIRAKIYDQLGGDNRFKGPLILDGGAKYEQLKINASDAQLLETRLQSITIVGMIFGVPSHLLNLTDKSTAFGKGLEELTQSFIDFTCGPHLKTIEDELNYKLYGNRRRRARFDRDSFVRGDLESRAKALQVLLGGAQGPGTISQNEARERIGAPKKTGAEYDRILGWGTPNAQGAKDAAPAPAEQQPEPQPAKPNKRRATSK